MDLNTKKEEFSYGYLQLICATNGLALEKTSRAIDNIGIEIPRENIITNKTLLNLVQRESQETLKLFQSIENPSHDRH